jgi:hypothetical protein
MKMQCNFFFLFHFFTFFFFLFLFGKKNSRRPRKKTVKTADHGHQILKQAKTASVAKKVEDDLEEGSQIGMEALKRKVNKPNKYNKKNYHRFIYYYLLFYFFYLFFFFCV